MTPEIVNGCKLYLGDCLDVLPALDTQVDAIITDLPYGTTACKWDEVIPFAPMWEQAKRLLKPRGAFVTTASQPFTSALVMSNPKWFRDEWIWKKNTGGNPMILDGHPNRNHESIIVFGRGTTAYNPQKQLSISKRAIESAKAGMTIRRVGASSNHVNMKFMDGKFSEYVNPTSVQEFDSVPRATGLLHPTQKPVALYEYLIRTYTNTGDVVLDFCMGSGTTGVAAIQTGRKFIGIERERKYYKIADKRIAQAQPPLFVPVGEKHEKLELTL